MHNRVKAVAEFGGKDFFYRVIYRGIVHYPLSKTDKPFADFFCPCVTCHYKNYVAEIGFASLIVRKGGVIHYLKENVKNVLVRFLNFV